MARLSIRWRAVLVAVLSIVLLATPAMAGFAVVKVADNKASHLKYTGAAIKELDKSQNTQEFEKLSQNEDYKLLKNTLLKNKYVLENEYLLEVIDTTDNKPVYVLAVPFVQNNKPGIIGIASKDGQTLATAIQGVASDSKTIDIEIYNISQDKTGKKVTSKVKKFTKENRKSLASFLIKPAYALDAHSFCIDFCNFMCGAGWGGVGCTLTCELFSGGIGTVLCPALCYSLTWAACNYGCPWYCTNVIGV